MSLGGGEISFPKREHFFHLFLSDFSENLGIFLEISSPGPKLYAPAAQQQHDFSAQAHLFRLNQSSNQSFHVVILYQRAAGEEN